MKTQPLLPHMTTTMLIAVTLLSLAACGGGGGGGGGSAAAPAPNDVPRFAYVTNYNDNTVSIYTVNPSTGQLRHNGYVAAGTNPVSVSVDPSGKFAYVANFGGGISAYRINVSTGALTQIDADPGFGGIQNFPAGTNPRFVTVDATGKFVYVANFGSNSVSAYSINVATGALMTLADVDAGAPGNQSSIATGASPFSVTVDPTGKFAYVANFGANNVSAYSINADSGALTSVGTSPVVIGTNNPSSVTVDPTGKFAYAANRGSNDVSAYRINASTGALINVGTVVAGTNPVSVSVDPSGKFAYVANFGSNRVSVYTINATTGALIGAGSSVTGFNPQSVTVDPSGRFAYVANFGSNSVSTYTINATTGGLISSLSTVTGRNGSWAMAMSKGTAAVTYTPKFAYVANTGSDNVSAYNINATTGVLTSIGAPVAAPDAPFSVAVDPSGRFAYVASAIDIVSAYSIDATTGALTSVGAVAAGDFPFSVTVDPSGKFAYVANRHSNDVSAYTINSSTGALTAVGAAVAAGTRPSSVTVDPSGRFAYVANSDSNDVSAYTINSSTGALTPVGVAAAAGTSPWSVSVHPSGMYVYVTNAFNNSALGGNSISVYSINNFTGALTIVDVPAVTGNTPFSVTADPSGKFAYVANFSSNNVWAYRINATGFMAGVPIPSDIVATETDPRSVTVDPSGKFAYVANEGSNNVSAYSIDAMTGAMTGIGTVATETGPQSITTTGTIQ